MRRGWVWSVRGSTGVGLDRDGAGGGVGWGWSGMLRGGASSTGRGLVGGRRGGEADRHAEDIGRVDAQLVRSCSLGTGDEHAGGRVVADVPAALDLLQAVRQAAVDLRLGLDDRHQWRRRRVGGARRRRRGGRAGGGRWGDGGGPWGGLGEGGAAGGLGSGGGFRGGGGRLMASGPPGEGGGGAGAAVSTQRQ